MIDNKILRGSSSTTARRVICSFDPDDKAVFIGQQVDVFVKAN